MAGYDTWKAREPDPWEHEDMPDEDIEPGEFLPEDYRYTADLLRKYCQNEQALFRAVCSNNLNIILAALDLAAEEPDARAAF